MANKVYDFVTERIIKSLQSGVIPWQKQWNTAPPTNFKSKHEYRGINRWLTMMNDFTSPYWLTFKQMEDLGGSLKGKQEYTIVVFFSMLEDRKDPDRKIPFLKYFRVYNLEQIDGIEVPEVEVAPNFNPLSMAAKILLEMPNRPTLSYGNNTYSYDSMTDEVLLAPKKGTQDEKFYQQAFHQLGHATGHPNRLKRFLKDTTLSIFKADSYSKEELIAEMTSAFVCGHSRLNLTNDNPKEYIASWLKVFQNDSKIVVQAANAAQKAADLIINKKD